MLLYNGELVTLAEGPPVEAEVDASWEVRGTASAALYLTESDQTDPAGHYRLQVSGDQLVFQRRASAGSWATPTTLFAIDATGIVLRNEPLPGVPAGIIHGGAMDGAPVVTKAGAFGDEETLLHVFDYLAAGKRRT